MQRKYLTITDAYFILLCYLLLSFLFRLTIPFGFEPDFLFRSHEILNGNNILSNFFQWYYAGYDFIRDCKVNGGVISLWHHINSEYLLCNEPITLKVLRILFQFFLFFLIFLLYLTIRKKRNKIAIVLISFLFPSVIYYTGVIGYEQIGVFVSALIFVFIESLIMIPLLLISLYFIDSGSFIVVGVFVVLYYSNLIILDNFGYKKVVFFNGIVILFLFVAGMSILPFLYNIPIIGGKAFAIFNDYTTIYSDVATKYPLILRPVVTFLTGVFMTPEGLKVIITYIIAGFFFFKYLFVIFRSDDIKNKTILISVFTVILSFVFTLPGFSNSKYYIFLLPFIFQSFSSFISFRKMIFFNILLSLSIPFFLVIYRL